MSVDGNNRRVEVVLIYQSLLGIYGDRGNASVLVKRLAWRGFDPVLTTVEPPSVKPCGPCWRGPRGGGRLTVSASREAAP